MPGHYRCRDPGLMPDPLGGVLFVELEGSTSVTGANPFAEFSCKKNITTRYFMIFLVYR